MKKQRKNRPQHQEQTRQPHTRDRNLRHRNQLRAARGKSELSWPNPDSCTSTSICPHPEGGYRTLGDATLPPARTYGQKPTPAQEVEPAPDALALHPRDTKTTRLFKEVLKQPKKPNPVAGKTKGKQPQQAQTPAQAQPQAPVQVVHTIITPPQASKRQAPEQPAPQLESWYVFPSSPKVLRVHGKIYNDPRFQDGDEIDTSTIEHIDYQQKVLKTKNSTYALGRPDSYWLTVLLENKEMDLYNTLTECFSQELDNVSVPA